MPVTSYYTVNGRIRSEMTGGTRTGYLPDALGSVTATVQGGAVVNTYRYKPYGAQLSKTGAGADPRFLWVGQHGYRDGNPVYVRARHYAVGQAAWTSFDSLWPMRRAYTYSGSDPTISIDPSGLDHCTAEEDCCTSSFIEEELRSRPTCPSQWSACTTSKDGMSSLKAKCIASISNKKPDCERVKGWIVDRLKICAGLTSTEGRGTAGTVVCCFIKPGDIKSCGEFCCDSYIPADEPCWRFCLVRHEESHSKECDLDSARHPRHGPWNESCAYWTQAKCLHSLYKDVCNLPKIEDMDFGSDCRHILQGCS